MESEFHRWQPQDVSYSIRESTFCMFLKNLIHLDDDSLVEVPYSGERSTPGSPLGKQSPPRECEAG
jgi:hypothetical protein